MSAKSSPLLEAPWLRWADRGNLVRREVAMSLEGMSFKSVFFKELREKIEKHRKEDVTQLMTARQEAWSSWDQRLARLEGRMSRADQLAAPLERVLAWRQSAKWFDRTQEIGQRYVTTLGVRA